MKRAGLIILVIFGVAATRQAVACDLTVASCRALELAGLSRQLMTEIRDKLRASGTKLSDVTCGGVRLGRHWVHLGGARILPYECTVGAAKLNLKGQADFYDDHGNEGAGPDTAMYVFQHSPSWSWK